MSAIELVDITKTYGAVRAVDGISHRINHGEFVTILGPSGSGKTTLLSLIAGLTGATEGSVWINDRDVTRLPSSKRNVGLVFQSYALFPHMSVQANVAFPLSIRKVPRDEITARVAEALDVVRLGGYGNRRPKELSGGQQQRVALARALVFKPDILLLDEPLAALDRKLRQEMQVELKELQRSVGITTILVTHDQEEALSLSDRIIVVNDGRIQQAGASEEVYREPQTRFVADFLGTANIFEGTLQCADGAATLLLDDGRTMPCPVAPERSGKRAFVMLRPSDCALATDQTEGGLTATVREAIYLGPFVRYHLDVAGNEVVVNSGERLVRHSPGSQVTLTWDPDDMWVLPEEPLLQGPDTEVQPTERINARQAKETFR